MAMSDREIITTELRRQGATDAIVEAALPRLLDWAASNRLRTDLAAQVSAVAAAVGQVKEEDRPKPDAAELKRRIAELVNSAPCRACSGNGFRDKQCTFCGDSTYDHVCNDERVGCRQCNSTGEAIKTEDVETLLAQARAAEREACAKVADEDAANWRALATEADRCGLAETAHARREKAETLLAFAYRLREAQS
jgi:hypothetical protein